MNKKVCIILCFIFLMFICITDVRATEAPAGVRYDVNYFKIDNSSSGGEIISMAGWAIYKEYNGNKINNGKDGAYAPTYYFRFVDTATSASVSEYTVTPGNNTGFSISCPLYDKPKNGTSCTNDNRHTLSGVYQYDNVDFYFDNWQVPMQAGKSYLLQMKIVIPASANYPTYGEITSDWFDIKIVDPDIDINSSTNGAHEIVLPNNSAYKYDIQKTNTVKFVASDAYRQNDSINYRGAHSSRNGMYTQGATYTIDSYRADPGFLSQPVKYLYYELDGDWAFSSWVQCTGNSFVITKSNPDCSNPINENQKKLCCETDIYYANSNTEYCCDPSKTNYSNTTTGLNTCCNSGKFAYDNPGYCCSKYPETCCNAETSRLDGDWLEKYAINGNLTAINSLWATYYPDGSMGKYVCCNSSNQVSLNPTFNPGHTYNLKSFKFSSYPQLLNLCSTSTTLPTKVCNASTTDTSGKSTTVNIPSLPIGNSKTGTITYTGTLTDLSGNLTNDNIAYSFLNVDPTKLKLEVTSLYTNNTGNNYTIKINYKITNISGSNLPGFDMTSNITICYDKVTIIDCSDNTQFNANKSYCCSLSAYASDSRCTDIPKNTLDPSLTCNNAHNTIFEDTIYEEDHNLYKISCKEKIEYDTKTIDYMKDNIIYSGTGFSYNIDVKDTVTCSLISKNANTNSTLNQTTVVSDLNNVFNNTIYMMNSNPNKNSGVYINSKTSSMRKVQYKFKDLNDSGTTTSSGTLNYYRSYMGIPLHQTYSGITSMKKVWTYKLELPKQYINRKDYTLTTTDKSSDINYLDGGNKYYTDIDQATGFNNFNITLNNAGIANMADVSGNVFTCQYLTENILISGGSFNSDHTSVATDSEYKYITRPISLSTPFLSNSRLDKATNWKEDNNTDLITSTINDDSIYQFTLTPGDIKNIKEYNENTNYSIWNFNNYTMYNNNVKTSNFLDCLKNGCSEIESVDTINLPNNTYREEKQGNFS